MQKTILHDQDWRDHQYLPDPDVDVEKFIASLEKAKEKLERNDMINPQK